MPKLKGPHPRGKTWMPLVLRLYRLGVLVVIVLLVRSHRVRLRVYGDSPVTLAEVRSFYPQAVRLRADRSPRMGLYVLDDAGDSVGYVVHTSPICDSIIGYTGPTDTLIAFDADWKVLGIQIRHSWDMRRHVEDVTGDEYFMNTWNGMTWDQAATLDLEEAGVEGVSGATMTSLAIAETITHRLHQADLQKAEQPAFRVGVHDVGLALVLLVALIMSFSHLRGATWFRRAFQLAVIVYVGFVTGNLIAQSVLAGWARSEVPWQSAPGLVLLVAAALVVPWTSRRSVYCLHICPHGALQELLGRIKPKRLRIRLPAAVTRGLRWLPPLLLALVLLITMLPVPINLTDVEPFDAYIIRSAGWATVTIAVVGLIASLFVPQAYCRFGCPTGELLRFVRTHGRADRFGRSDLTAALMVALAAILYWKYDVIETWLLR